MRYWTTTCMIFLILLANTVAGQEICDNAIDDDGDGLIDLLDDDCVCVFQVFDEVVGDFEDYDCCPDGPSQFDCLNDGWVTINGTPDFFNECDYVGDANWTMLELPLPSGSGAAAVIGGEHFGICMDNNMIVGETYDLSFWVEANTPILGECEEGKISLFGSPDCANLTNAQVCGGNWTEIGSWAVSTGDEWTEITFSFGVGNAYSAIAFGFQCNQQECPVFPYIFLDNINISGVFEGEPDLPILLLDGNCVEGFTLESLDDGGIGYQWYRDGISIIGATTNPWSIDPAFDGFYQVVVEYDIGCVISDSLEVVIDLNVLELQVEEMDISCFGAMDGSIEVAGLSPNIPISYQWSNGATAASITNLGPGTYTVTVTDANGCYQEQTFVISEPPLLTAGATVTQPLGANLGQAQVSAFGGTAPYVFEWPDGSNSVIRSDLEPGQYVVTVTDANGCEEEIIIDIFEPLIFDFDTTPQTCLLSCDGTASIIVEGGLEPYVIQWSDNFQGPDRIGLCGGIYFFTVIDDFGSMLSGSISIETDTEIELTADYQESVCLGSTTDITVFADGGQSPYTYQWLFGEETSTLTDQEPGVYQLTVTDAVGCSVTAGYEVTTLPEIVVDGVVTDTPCGLDEGAVDVFISGGVAPYTYLWSTGDTLDVLTGIPSGVYSITVSDSTACTAAAMFTVDNISDLSATAVASDVSCIGDSTGSVILTILGGTGPYQVQWSTGEVGPTVSDLPAGVYSVIIIDAGSCQVSYEYTIREISTQQVGADIVNVDCFGAATGSISIDVVNGVSPYMYDWQGMSGENTINDIAAGVYELSITDSLGCVYNYEYQITQEDSFSVVAEVRDNQCYEGSTGAIDLAVEPDSVTYLYTWSVPTTGPSLADLVAGSYGVSVTNHLGCEQRYQYSIEDGIEILIDAEISNVNCDGGGGISVSASGGNGGYTYVWSNTETGSIVADLQAGLYTVTVTDNEQCTKVDMYDVAPYTPLSIEPTVVDADCFGTATGSVGLSVTGGDAPYEYLWSSNQTASSIELLPADTYTVTVTDINDCSIVGSYSVSQPDELVLSLLDVMVACSDDLGLLTVSIDGGLPPYSILWSTGVTEDSILEQVGAYMVTVTDATGCSAEGAATISAPDALQIDVLSTTDPSPADGDGVASISVSGGVQPFVINWSSGATALTANNLSFGVNTVIVTDAEGCVVSRDILFDVSPISFIAFVGNNPCHEDCLGEIELEIEGGLLPYQVEWNTGYIGNPLTDLCEGVYSGTITDASGQLVSTEPIAISNPTDIVVEGQTYDISCVEQSDGSIEVTATGGTMPFVFIWNTNETGNLLAQLPVGSYIVTATDDAGCEESSSFTLEDIPLIDLMAEVTAISCDQPLGLISVLGENPYQYPILINGEQTTVSAEGTIDGLEAGTYAISYQVNSNCVLPVSEVTVVDLTDYSVMLQTANSTISEGVTLTIDLVLEGLLTLEGYTVEWTADQLFSCIETDEEGQCIAIEMNPDDSDVVTVVFIDSEGCETLLSLPITVLRNYDVYIPNVFHPKSDSGNDVFNIVMPKWIDQIDKFYVYDRWGNKMYSAENVSKQTIQWWDATYQGTAVAQGVYVYYIEVTVPDQGPTSYVGDITVIR